MENESVVVRELLSLLEAWIDAHDDGEMVPMDVYERTARVMPYREPKPGRPRHRLRLVSSAPKGERGAE